MPSNNKISVVTLLQAYRLLTNVITYQLPLPSRVPIWALAQSVSFSFAS